MALDVRLERTRSADGTTLAWASTGTGPALVQLPAIPFGDLVGERRVPSIGAALDALARRLRLVQYDGRGAGHSQRVVADVGLEAHLADLDAIIAAARLQRYALLGSYHSVVVALAHAARHPARVSALALFGGGPRGWDLMSGQGTQALLSLIERDWDTFVESVAHAWLGWPTGDEGPLAADWFRGATTPAVALATIREMSGVDMTPELGRIGCPVLVLHREGGPVIPRELSERFVVSLPAGQLRLLEGSSAGLFTEGGLEVVDLMASFVGGERTTGAEARAGRPARATRPDGLTPREVEVLRLLARGETNGGIATALGVSVNTVERHVANIYRKIDARGRADAAGHAVRHGIA
jgi:DNA-binding CsgD family transcriptional regulator/pimeloyl-ACP methyl ester carboxylesterase